MSERRACRILELPRSSKRYRKVERAGDEEIMNRLREYAARWPRFGYERMQMLLIRDGIKVNIKRTYRLYKLCGLNLKRAKKRKRYEKRGTAERTEVQANVRWAMDFVSDRLSNGRNLRVLAMIDEVTRECICLEVDYSLTGKHVVSALNKTCLFRDLPEEILSDNGPEFTSNAVNAWCYDRKVTHRFIDPGCPTQNSRMESFNGRLRDECLNQHLFRNLAEARHLLESWRMQYNHARPHGSLNGFTPNEYAASLAGGI